MHFLIFRSLPQKIPSHSLFKIQGNSYASKTTTRGQSILAYEGSCVYKPAPRWVLRGSRSSNIQDESLKRISWCCTHLGFYERALSWWSWHGHSRDLWRTFVSFRSCCCHAFVKATPFINSLIMSLIFVGINNAT